MGTAPAQISVCICTLRRPEMLLRLLQTLAKQQTLGKLEYSIVVADNAPDLSARRVVEHFSGTADISVVYASEPERNIAKVRNTALRHASGDLIAFIDDDEFPECDWLLRMSQARERYGAAGILGPVRPHFAETPPQWIIKGRFCERPEFPTGKVMHWRQCRTGNVLFEKRIVEGVAEPFSPQFDTGGEDIDFFMRMTARGHVFRWCNEAVTYETVPRDRWKRTYMLRRALLRGRNILKIRDGRSRLIIRSTIALPLYLIIVPFALLAGQHVFMKYLIKLCDHAGRLLALAGLNPIQER
jgi:succinoglycan biosynthesis protein ExoM